MEDTSGEEQDHCGKMITNVSALANWRSLIQKPDGERPQGFVLVPENYGGPNFWTRFTIKRPSSIPILLESLATSLGVSSLCVLSSDAKP